MSPVGFLSGLAVVAQPSDKAPTAPKCDEELLITRGTCAYLSARGGLPDHGSRSRVEECYRAIFRADEESLLWHRVPKTLC